MKVTILGLGSWGTALAVRLGPRHELRGWTHDPGQREALRKDGENRKYLPGVPLPPSLSIFDDPAPTLPGADLVLFAVPSFAVRSLARAVKKDLGRTPVVNVAKGMEEGSGSLPLQVLAEELSPEHPAASLVGPSHAEEAARDHPTAVVATSRDPAAAQLVQTVVSDDRLRVYTNDDPFGVELAASLKNVIALAAGIAGGLGYGDNTLGALLTRGLAEMARLGTELGARPETFFGLAGVGDLVTTCVSRWSRNRRVGEAVGRGEPLAQVLRGMTMVAEGVPTTRAARDMARRNGVEMPIVERVHAVLFENQPPLAAIHALMTRERKAEV
jgi:glycerol-3-phosphate dehydrogenase (NAD(P)+)